MPQHAGRAPGNPAHLQFDKDPARRGCRETGAKVSTRIEVAVHLTAAGTRTASPKGDGSIETEGDTP
jgi:hypothetical protein